MSSVDADDGMCRWCRCSTISNKFLVIPSSAPPLITFWSLCVPIPYTLWSLTVSPLRSSESSSCKPGSGWPLFNSGQRIVVAHRPLSCRRLVSESGEQEVGSVAGEALSRALCCCHSICRHIPNLPFRSNFRIESPARREFHF
jgi:hypothetical protein